MNPPIPIPPVAGAEAIPWVLLTVILFGAAIVAWGITEAIKKTAMAKYRHDHEGVTAKAARRVLWWTPLLVVVSIIIGTGFGAAVAAFEWKWLYGAAVGAMGGGLASFLVSLFKGNISALAKKMTGKAAQPVEEASHDDADE